MNNDSFSITITKKVQNETPSHGHRHEVTSFVQIAPHMNQPLPQIVDVLHFRPVNVVLYRTPYLVVHQWSFCVRTACIWIFYNTKINITWVKQSIVATRFRYVGQYNNQFVENLSLNATVKEFFENRPRFFDSQCIYN